MRSAWYWFWRLYYEAYEWGYHLAFRHTWAYFPAIEGARTGEHVCTRCGRMRL